MPRDFFVADDQRTGAGRFSIHHEGEDDDAREMHGLRFTSKSLADAVVTALRDAYQMGFQDGRGDVVRSKSPDDDDEEPF